MTPQMGLIAWGGVAFILGSEGCVGACVAENGDAGGWGNTSKNGSGKEKLALVGAGRGLRELPWEGGAGVM